MRKFKIRVNSKQAVESIKSGMSDLALMEKYGLSARGLQSLFKKLVAAGEIDQVELNRRLLSSQQSHVIDLIVPQPVYTKKAVVYADQALKDIQSGMNDVQLMRKYDISAQGLESLFSKLVSASLISSQELENRNLKLKSSEIGLEENSLRSVEPLEEPYLAPIRWSLKSSLREHRLLAAALLGACIGMGLVVLALFLTVGIDKLFYDRNDFKQRNASLKAANEALFVQAQEMIGALEAIAKRDYPAESGNSFARFEYEKCMRDCESSNKGGDELERAFVINCKKECLNLHSERFKKIRELYH